MSTPRTDIPLAATALTRGRENVLALSPLLLAAIAVAVLHFAWLRLHFAPATMSPDANGYVVQARLIATEGRTWFSSASPAEFVGMHWLETDRGVFHSRYSPGWPLILAGAWRLGGLDWALLVNPLLASATVLLVFFLGRRIMAGWAALLASVVVALAPAANQHALDADAHTSATFFLVAGVLALLRFGDTLRPATGALAGLLLGVVPSIRYPEAVVGLAVAGWLAWRVRPLGRVWPAVLGAAAPVAVVLVHNATAYGAVWKTGYALTHEQTGFGLSYFTAHALPYLESLGGQGIGLFFAFGAAGLAAMAADRERRSEGLLFAGIVVPLLLLYMAYYFGAGGGGAAVGNLRFLIPTFPFFALAGAWLLGRVAGTLGSAGRAAVIMGAALQALIGFGTSAQTLAQTKVTLTGAARARAAAEKAVPAGSVLIVDRSLAESLDAVGRWKLVEETIARGASGARGGLGGMPGAGRGFAPGRNFEAGEGDDAPSPQQAGKNRIQQERYGTVSGDSRRARVWADVSTWAAGAPVYWFTRDVDSLDEVLPAGADYESIAEIDAPTGGFALPGGMARGAMGPMGRGGPAGGMPGGRGGMMPFRGPPGIMGPGFGAPGRPGGGNVPATKLRLVKVTQPKNATAL